MAIGYRENLVAVAIFGGTLVNGSLPIRYLEERYPCMYFVTWK